MTKKKIIIFNQCLNFYFSANFKVKTIVFKKYKAIKTLTHLLKNFKYFVKKILINNKKNLIHKNCQKRPKVQTLNLKPKDFKNANMAILNKTIISRFKGNYTLQ